MTEQSVIPTCYRHPDRETRLACSNCERPVCVDCVRSAAVGQRCLECVRDAGEQRIVDMDELRRPSTRTAVVTYAVLAASVALFVFPVVLPDAGNALAIRLAQINPLVAQGEWWRLLTAAFLHGGIAHLGFNMYALYLFGPELERQVGSVPFAALYVASALAGGAAYYAWDPSGVAVGASAAIFGLFGAWIAASYRGRHTAAGQASLRQLLVLLGINLALGFIPGSNIAWQAHLGGLIAGVAISFVWALPVLRSRSAARTIAAALVAVAALATVV